MSAWWEGLSEHEVARKVARRITEDESVPIKYRLSAERLLRKNRNTAVEEYTSGQIEAAHHAIKKRLGLLHVDQ